MGGEPVSAGACVERGDLDAGRGEQQAVPAVGAVGRPREVGGVAVAEDHSGVVLHPQSLVDEPLTTAEP